MISSNNFHNMGSSIESWCEITFSKWSGTAISYATEILSDALSGKPHQC